MWSSNSTSECMKVKVNVKSLMKVKSLSRVWLFATPRTVAYQATLSIGFSRQECWSGLPFPSPGDLPNPGIEPRSPALQADVLPSEPPGNQKEMKIGYRKDICIPAFIATLFTIAKIWIQPKRPSVDEWIKKMQHIQYTAMWEKEILPFATTWKELEGIMLSKISETEKDKYGLLSFTCGI